MAVGRFHELHPSTSHGVDSRDVNRHAEHTRLYTRRPDRNARFQQLPPTLRSRDNPEQPRPRSGVTRGNQIQWLCGDSLVRPTTESRILKSERYSKSSTSEPCHHSAKTFIGVGSHLGSLWAFTATCTTPPSSLASSALARL